MKVAYINPFVQASVSVLKTLVGKTPLPGRISARPEIFTTNDVNIVCGVTGDVYGHVLYGMTAETADRIASAMLGETVAEFDQLAASAISELGNIVSGNSLTMLSEKGFMCDISPPTIIEGTNVKIASIDIPVLVIPIDIDDIGSLEIIVCLKHKEASVSKSA
ncbi:MAG TPA: chemotaxis protein CheX [Fimbriimonadaceae bacterium]|nr:chemotaxis protein CheX [Fimbriimonadaceae bacterium]